MFGCADWPFWCYKHVLTGEWLLQLECQHKFWPVSCWCGAYHRFVQLCPHNYHQSGEVLLQLSDGVSPQARFLQGIAIGLPSGLPRNAYPMLFVVWQRHAGNVRAPSILTMMCPAGIATVMGGKPQSFAIVARRSNMRLLFISTAVQAWRDRTMIWSSNG